MFPIGIEFRFFYMLMEIITAREKGCGGSGVGTEEGQSLQYTVLAHVGIQIGS